MRCPANSEFARMHGSRLERDLDELGALGVVRELADAHALEEVVQVGLHARHAERDLVGDLLVGGRRGERAAVAVRTAEGDEHRALRRGEGFRDGDVGGGTRRPRGALAGGAEEQLGRTDAHAVAVVQRLLPMQALAVEERAVRRQSVVGQHPVAAHGLELGVQARNLVVVCEREVARRVSPDRQPPGGQRADDLLAAGPAIDEERRAGAFGFELGLQLDRGAAVHQRPRYPGLEPRYRGLAGRAPGRLGRRPARRDSEAMRPILISTAAALALWTGCGSSQVERPTHKQAPPRYSSSQVSAFFKAVTGDPLSDEPSTYFDSLTADRGDLDRSTKMRERYGSFMIFVLRRPGSESIYKSDGGVPIKPDANGIYWHDGGQTAMKPYKNVVLSWNADDQQQLDERFKRLDNVLSELGEPAAQV